MADGSGQQWEWRSPPGWPAPPVGWRPPEGWAPPPEWPPAPPGWAFWVPVRRGTNGLAVASLVLSILWILGLGSILAVVFGAVARRQIRRSAGAEGGDGLALAGLIVGIAGIVGVGLLVALGAVVSHVLQPHRVRLHYGQPADLASLPGNHGISQVTVESVAQPVASPANAALVAPGDELAVAAVRVCAGSSAVRTGLSNVEFQAVLPGGVTTPSAAFDARAPGIEDVAALGAGQCGVGYVTFEVAAGTAVRGIRFEPPFWLDTYTWSPG